MDIDGIFNADACMPEHDKDRIYFRNGEFFNTGLVKIWNDYIKAIRKYHPEYAIGYIVTSSWNVANPLEALQEKFAAMGVIGEVVGVVPQSSKKRIFNIMAHLENLALSNDDVCDDIFLIVDDSDLFNLSYEEVKSADEDMLAFCQERFIRYPNIFYKLTWQQPYLKLLINKHKGNSFQNGNS